MARILVVDDSAIMRKNLHTLLSQAGHTVVAEAGTGQDAVEVYERVRPELVTMDITMPGMDGIKAVREIMGRFPEARIVMISAEHQKSLVYEALKSGARHYLTKPLRLNVLVEVLESVLATPVPEAVVLEPIPLAPQRHAHFALEDKAGVLRLKLGADFAAEDCTALREALADLARLAPLRLELAPAAGIAWHAALVRALFGVMGEWQVVHGAASWMEPE